MKLYSKIKRVGKAQFPQFRAALLYMHQFDLASPSLPAGYEDFEPLFKSMVEKSPLKTGRAYVTIDSRLVLKGKPHRLPGPHIDGNYNPSWGGGGNGWLLGDKTKRQTPEEHLRDYASKLGGMLIASNYSACRAWKGKFNFLPGEGGNCLAFVKEIGKMLVMKLSANMIYLTNSTCIHESLPVEEDTRRMLMRITFSNVKVL